MKKLLCVGFLLLSALAIVPGALATEPNNESATYEFSLETPNTAKASNGATITLDGSGEFGVHPKSASGGGTYSTSGGDTGTWVVTGLVSFTPYGCGVVFGTPLPPELCGGQLILNAHLVSSANPSVMSPAVIWITCLIGPKVPGGAQEGVRVNTRGTNYNKEVAGENVFIKE